MEPPSKNTPAGYLFSDVVLEQRKLPSVRRPIRSCAHTPSNSNQRSETLKPPPPFFRPHHLDIPHRHPPPFFQPSFPPTNTTPPPLLCIHPSSALQASAVPFPCYFVRD
ncbi:hypothetical protein L211DRAFT_364275 [Terfezia boudieri ATCC MYA-4762]|uniref:Uncharacterized protein n=1 Tax=Terfezia boudieri ATCC MYA-4762 TaxID=1051890 RepID=A0A3N4LZ51_9PEZI|nr:hypothetical protein L211DRAFT_364275 [Terfezia boudieri ATCC MYA-4762]